MSLLAFKRTLAAAFAVPDDQFALGEATFDAADVAPGVVAQHVASLDIRFNTPDGPTATVANDTSGIDVIAGVEEVRGIALIGCGGGGTNGKRKKKSNDGGLHGVLKSNVRATALPDVALHPPSCEGSRLIPYILPAARRPQFRSA